MDSVGFVAGVAATPAAKTGVEKGVRTRGDELPTGRLRAADVGRQRLDLLWYKSKQQQYANDGQAAPEGGMRVKVKAEDGVRVKAELVDRYSCAAVDSAKEVENRDVEMCVDAISAVRIDSALHANKLVRTGPSEVVLAKPPPTTNSVRRNTLAGSGMSDVIAPSLGTAKKIRLEEFKLSAMAADAGDDVVEAAPDTATAEQDADEKKKALNRNRWRKSTTERKGSVQHLKRVVSELKAKRVAGGTAPIFGEDMETSIPYESRFSSPCAFGSSFAELPKLVTKKPEKKRRRGGVATLNEKTVAKVQTARRAVNLQTVPEDRAVAKNKQRGFSFWQPLRLFR